MGAAAGAAELDAAPAAAAAAAASSARKCRSKSVSASSSSHSFAQSTASSFATSLSAQSAGERREPGLSLAAHLHPRRPRLTFFLEVVEIVVLVEGLGDWDRSRRSGLGGGRGRRGLGRLGGSAAAAHAKREACGRFYRGPRKGGAIDASS